MSSLFETMRDFLRDDGWPVTEVEPAATLRTGYEGRNGRWDCYAYAREEEQQSVFYSICSAAVPEARRGAMAEFITRINNGIVIGNFELDFDDGELRYKTSIDVEGDELSPALMRQLIYANVFMFDLHLPAVMTMIYTDKSPLECIDQFERQRAKS